MKTHFCPPPNGNSLQKSLLLIVLNTCFFIFPSISRGQSVLYLKEAIVMATDNYSSIKAKTEFARSSRAAEKQAQSNYLPNGFLSAQTSYGTVNGQNGPVYTFSPVGLASSGLPLSEQNWNAAFGSLLTANVNWDFFTFGKVSGKVRVAEVVAGRDEHDVKQEIFQHQVRVSATYLNLLAAQRLSASYQKNLERADTLRKIIVAKALHDLVAGVDSSQANAEVSNARSTLLRALNTQEEQNSNLVNFLGIPPKELLLDTMFLTRLPQVPPLTRDPVSTGHPLLQYYQSRIGVSDAQVKYYRALNYPTLTFGGVIQARGSGFGDTYTTRQSNYSENLTDGINPDRVNFVLAIGITWNLFQPLKVKGLIKSQRFQTAGLKYEYDLVKQQLQTQADLADRKIRNAVADYFETPLQVKAATEAYQQKVILYRNGLTNLVEVTQALYVLTRAETDRDIALANVWQAVLLKASAEGDFSIFSANL
jgi:outer membrane protein TolC